MWKLVAEGLDIRNRTSENVYGGHRWGRESKNMGCLLEAREEAHAKKHISMVAGLQFVLQPHGVIG